jgi:hypothetical protein
MVNLRQPEQERQNGNSLSCVLPCGATIMGATGAPAKLARRLYSLTVKKGLLPRLAETAYRSPYFHVHGWRDRRHGVLA